MQTLETMSFEEKIVPCYCHKLLLGKKSYSLKGGTAYTMIFMNFQERYLSFSFSQIFFFFLLLLGFYVLFPVMKKKKSLFLFSCSSFNFLLFLSVRLLRSLIHFPIIFIFLVFFLLFSSCSLSFSFHLVLLLLPLCLLLLFNLSRFFLSSSEFYNKTSQVPSASPFTLSPSHFLYQRQCQRRYCFKVKDNDTFFFAQLFELL